MQNLMAGRFIVAGTINRVIQLYMKYMAGMTGKARILSTTASADRLFNTPYKKAI